MWRPTTSNQITSTSCEAPFLAHQQSPHPQPVVHAQPVQLPQAHRRDGERGAQDEHVPDHRRHALVGR